MQVVGSDKFKFFPVRFNNITVPFGDILAIKQKRTTAEVEYVEIRTASGSTHYPSDISFEKANEIYTQAFKDCEF